MSRLATIGAVVLGLVLASLPFLHYRLGARHHAPHVPEGGSHAHHAH
jgi:hypothetical protein